MTSCTIIISHFESISFLKCCLRQIKKHHHPNIKQNIIVVDQSTLPYQLEFNGDEFDVEDEIIIVHTEPLYSGFGIDWAIRNVDIQTEYICQIHVDCAPISQAWLYLPIKLIEENNFSFVGQLQFIADGKASIYPPNPFFAMAQCFNVARTETYKEMSFEAGFTRFHNRPESGLTFKNDDWNKWASADYNARGSDDDIVAFAWESKHRNTDKLGLAISGYIEPNFGRLIDDIVFHFGSANEARGVMDSMSELYRYYTQKINEDYSDELIEEMVSLAKKNKPPEMQILTRNFWDGKLKKSFPPSEELNKRIEYLKVQWYNNEEMKFMKKYE